jgi:7tm Chemosensory receptor
MLKTVIHLVLVVFNLLSLFYVSNCNKRLACIFNTMKRLQTDLKDLKQSAIIWQIRTIVILGQLASNALYFGSIFNNFKFHDSFLLNAYIMMTILGRAFSGSLVNGIGAHFVTICLILGSYLRGIGEQLESLTDRSTADKLAELRCHLSKIFELANEVNEIYGFILLLILTYHNCYMQIDAFNAAVVLYNISSGRAVWSWQDCSYFAWACVDCAKAMVYFFAAYKMQSEVLI